MKGIITFIIFCLVCRLVRQFSFIPMLVLILLEESGATTATNPFKLEWYWIVGIIIYFILSLKLIYKSEQIGNKIFEFLKID